MSVTKPTNHIEIVTSVQRRRRWTAAEKVRMVEETFEPGMTVSLVARRHGRRDLVIIDTLPAHKGTTVERLIAAARATLLYLPNTRPISFRSSRRSTS